MVYRSSGIDKAISVCQNINKYWASGDFDNKQRIQNALFPNGLLINPESRAYLTDNMNQVFKLIPCLASVSEDGKNEKVGKIADSPCSVARTAT